MTSSRLHAEDDPIRAGHRTTPCIRLIREVTQPGRSGPINGQYALQRALRQRAPSWLKVGGSLQPGEIPWYWCWKDTQEAAARAGGGGPFIAGPNILFTDSRHPRRAVTERILCDAASCRLLFTESTWYRDLIRRNRGPANRAPIVLWPYPIDPKPGGPLPPRYDLLILAKDRRRAGLMDQLRRVYRRLHALVYGQFDRAELYTAARRSRCCLYLSSDDRGPLALAEILLSGCPAVGVPTGAPFIQPGQTGVVVNRFGPSQCIDAINTCHRFDRHTVARLAAEQFDPARIVDTILRALREAVHPSGDG